MADQQGFQLMLQLTVATSHSFSHSNGYGNYRALAATIYANLPFEASRSQVLIVVLSATGYIPIGGNHVSCKAVLRRLTSGEVHTFASNSGSTRSALR